MIMASLIWASSNRSSCGEQGRTAHEKANGALQGILYAPVPCC